MGVMVKTKVARFLWTTVYIADITHTCIDKKLIGESGVVDVVYGAGKYRR